VAVIVDLLLLDGHPHCGTPPVTLNDMRPRPGEVLHFREDPQITRFVHAEG